MYATKGLLLIAFGLVVALTIDQCQALVVMDDAVDGVMCIEDPEEPNRLICTCNDKTHHVSAHNKKIFLFKYAY